MEDDDDDLWHELPFDKRDVFRENNTDVDFNYLSFEHRNKHVTNTLVLTLLTSKVTSINVNYCPKLNDVCLIPIFHICTNLQD